VTRRFVIPSQNLPPGFAGRVDRPPEPPAQARPAATVVLLRDHDAGPETLLLKRHHSAGFVPEAWVYPGGRVDAADGAPELAAQTDGMGARPEPGYWLAGARELFEETAVLLARDPAGAAAGDAVTDARLARWRARLLDDEASLLDALRALELRLDLRDVVHFAHWITPVAEPRRYDTHFFLARLPAGAQIAFDPREMTGALWLTPEAALERFRAGRLAMVFPTVRTLESLASFASVDAALAAFRGAAVATVAPRLVRTGDGVAIVVDDD
jgi:8-oxo-dGTP pyrophosphatase MutT (NUDIX family)